MPLRDFHEANRNDRVDEVFLRNVAIIIETLEVYYCYIYNEIIQREFHFSLIKIACYNYSRGAYVYHVCVV